MNIKLTEVSILDTRNIKERRFVTICGEGQIRQTMINVAVDSYQPDEDITMSAILSNMKDEAQKEYQDGEKYVIESIDSRFVIAGRYLPDVIKIKNNKNVIDEDDEEVEVDFKLSPVMKQAYSEIYNKFPNMRASNRNMSLNIILRLLELAPANVSVDTLMFGQCEIVHLTFYDRTKIVVILSSDASSDASVEKENDFMQIIFKEYDPKHAMCETVKIKISNNNTKALWREFSNHPMLNNMLEIIESNGIHIE